jgi:hypothetical protein
MRFSGVIAFIVIFLSVSTLGSSSALAETISASGTIKIQATVLPTHYITVDKNGKIIKIESNTNNRPTAIKVYVEKMVAEHETPLTDSIYQNYRQLVPDKSYIGVLYEKPSALSLLQKLPNLLPFVGYSLEAAQSL